MAKIVIIADTGAWAFANRANALKRYCPKDLEIHIAHGDTLPIERIPLRRYDLVFLLNTIKAVEVRRLLREQRVDIPLVISHNSGVGRRREMLLETMQVADYTVINNHAVWSELIGIARSDIRCCNISNGVDLTTFNVTTPIEDRPHRILWAGSHMKAEDPDDVKGFHRVIGPLYCEVRDHTEWDMHVLVAKRGAAKNPPEMAAWYNEGSYLVCPSTSEGTPNIVLEAAACGCIPVCQAIGNVPECFEAGESWALPGGIEFTDYWDALVACRERREEMSAAAVRAIRGWDWAIRAQHFYRLFRRLLAGERPDPFTWLDSHSLVEQFSQPDSNGTGRIHSPHALCGVDQ